jgi:hypothetical protein
MDVLVDFVDFYQNLTLVFSFLIKVNRRMVSLSSSTTSFVQGC